MIQDYRVLLSEICSNLTSANHTVAVQLASVPDEIRGYGHVKDKSIKTAKELEAKLLEKFRNPRPTASARSVGGD